MAVERRLTPVAARRAFLAGLRRRQVGWWAGLAASAMTLVFALDGRWVPAAICGVVAAVLLWLSGLWVSPWGRDAYVRRVMHAWEAWATGAQWAYDAFAHRRARLRARVERLGPPPGYEEEHERLLALLSDIENNRADRSLPYPDRVRRGVAAARAVDKTADRLCAGAVGSQQLRYCKELAEARDRRRAEYADATAKAERATEELLAKLGQLRVPPPASDAHQSLVHAFEDYLAAARQFHAACQDHLPDEAADAATRLDDAVAVLRASSRAILASLEYDARWPQSDAATTEP